MFYVTEEVKCPECAGRGVVTHPAWELYYEENGEHGILDEEGHLDVSLDVAWFQTQGYDYPPDEEVPCWVCEGEGTIRREVDLAAALDALTNEIIAELVETLGEVIHHWWNDAWSPTPDHNSPVVTTPQEAYYRAHALYRRHKHLLEEETDEPANL
jgi:hypothetical protein